MVHHAIEVNVAASTSHNPFPWPKLLQIKILDTEERVVEIARLLSGKRISDAAITNAKELLNQ